MPHSEESQRKQIAKLKEMLAQNAKLMEQMKQVIADLESKTKHSADRKRNN
jgi:hypothetical protein